MTPKRKSILHAFLATLILFITFQFIAINFTTPPTTFRLRLVGFIMVPSVFAIYFVLYYWINRRK